MIPGIREDVRAMAERDPAAKSSLEVVLTYPGLHAVWAHRLAHALHGAGHGLLARVLSHLTRLLTGVEIHPAAEIGRRVTIDHGMGVVIGETASVGDDVHLYHGVTLGGNDPRPVERHPTVRDDVVIGANATLLGAIEVGEGAQIGAGAVVTEDVPPGATAVGETAEILADDSDAEDTDETVTDAGADPATGATGDGHDPGTATGATDGGVDAGDTSDPETDADGETADGGDERRGSDDCGERGTVL